MSENRIHLLDTLTANQIAAGEVVERPLSVVKELVENSIDAAATRIEIKIFDAPCTRIQVADNGLGISPEDMRLAVKRHATSKIQALADLDSLFTLGFRGEALPSIAAVSHLTITSKQAQNTLGYRMKVEGGQAGIPEEAGARDGTVILVEQLFYNAPARKKFLKTPRWELSLISDCLEKLALSHPHIAFKLVQGSKTLFSSDGSGDLGRAITSIYGADIMKGLVKLAYKDDDISVQGFVSLPELNRADRSHYTFFVNQRWVRSRELASMVDQAYDTLMPKRRYPLVVLHLTLPQHSIDVNVHPAKMEVKFQDAAPVKEALCGAIAQALLHQEALAPRLQMPSPAAPPSAGLPQTSAKPHLAVDQQSGFIQPQQPPSLRLHEAAALPLAKQNLEVRLHNRPAEVQRLSFPALSQDNTHTPQMPSTSPSAAVDNENFIPQPSPEPADHVMPGRLIYSQLQILGQAGGSYIVAAGEDGLYILDQHAAHERVLYEKILAAAAHSSGESRLLALPQTITLTVAEHIWLTESILHLDQLGFILEHFGENTYIIRGTPLWYEGGDGEGLLRALLSSMTGIKGQPIALRREELFMAACKQAVKANSYLSPPALSALLAALDKCENPATCPHGRPVAIKLTFTEIRKRFLRSEPPLS